MLFLGAAEVSAIEVKAVALEVAVGDSAPVVEALVVTAIAMISDRGGFGGDRGGGGFSCPFIIFMYPI